MPDISDVEPLDLVELDEGPDRPADHDPDELEPEEVEQDG